MTRADQDRLEMLLGDAHRALTEAQQMLTDELASKKLNEADPLWGVFAHVAAARASVVDVYDSTRGVLKTQGLV